MQAVGSQEDLVHRIERGTVIEDARAEVRKKYLESRGFSGVEGVEITDVYTVEFGGNAGDIEGNDEDLKLIASNLRQKVVHDIAIDAPMAPDKFGWAIEVGFLPGVTDNVSHTVLGVTGYSPDGIEEAQRIAYEAVQAISIDGGFHYRTDIADKAVFAQGEKE